MRRHAAAVLIAFAAATSFIGTTAAPVSAECTFGDAPWPEITPAIRTARSIVVGDIVTDFTHADLHLGADQEPRAYALRVTLVLRGEMRPGDLLDVQFLLPNWPQTHYSGADGPSPSCSYVRAAPGEVVALAFDALQPGGPMSANGEEWIQPPTRYHAVGVIKGPGGTFGTGAYRERVTLGQLRDLASLPPTDTADPMAADRVPLDSGARSMLVAAGLVGLWLGWRRLAAWRGGPAGGAGRRPAERALGAAATQRA